MNLKNISIILVKTNIIVITNLSKRINFTFFAEKKQLTLIQVSLVTRYYFFFAVFSKLMLLREV